MTSDAKQKLDELFKSYGLHAVGKNTLLYEPGSEIKEVCYITQGLVKQYILTPKGEEVVVNIFQPPVILPMMVLLSGRPNLGYFETLEEVKLYKAPVVEIYNDITSDADIMNDVAQRFASAVYGLSERIINLTTIQQKQQLHQLLKYLAKKENEDHSSEWLSLPPTTHGQLASWLGTARETVSRLLKQLEDDGDVQSKGKIYRVRI